MCFDHTPTQQNLLSYSFSHSVDLPLVFYRGCFVFTSPLRETVTFFFFFYTHNNFRYGSHFSLLVQTRCLHIMSWFGFVYFFFLLLFICICICFSPRQQLYMAVYRIQTHAFSPFTKGMVNYFLKSFQYLKITVLLYGSLYSCSRSASCPTSSASL